jgi:hypothetical protein
MHRLRLLAREAVAGPGRRAERLGDLVMKPTGGPREDASGDRWG